MLGRNGKVYVWRKSDERFRPDCLGQLDDFETTCRASVMFWGCITYHGVGTLVAIDGNMNTDKYISVLDDNRCPIVVRHFSDRPWIFQEDNHVMSLYEQISGKRKMEFVPFSGPHKAQILILSKMCGKF